eukprot:GHRQ01018965.1.p2 GENE.GHRQ01018965.1~~GHRQ01018965.1.p2  ORF type:complete len:106 (-),score=1.54 GHRQ01018965.1:380-697(-)
MRVTALSQQRMQWQAFAGCTQGNNGRMAPSAGCTQPDVLLTCREPATCMLHVVNGRSSACSLGDMHQLVLVMNTVIPFSGCYTTGTPPVFEPMTGSMGNHLSTHT